MVSPALTRLLYSLGLIRCGARPLCARRSAPQVIGISSLRCRAALVLGSLTALGRSNASQYLHRSDARRCQHSASLVVGRAGTLFGALLGVCVFVCFYVFLFWMCVCFVRCSPVLSGALWRLIAWRPLTTVLAAFPPLAALALGSLRSSATVLAAFPPLAALALGSLRSSAAQTR